VKLVLIMEDRVLLMDTTQTCHGRARVPSQPTDQVKLV